MKLMRIDELRGRVVGMTGTLLWVGFLVMGATPASSAVYCAKAKGVKPSTPLTLRETKCKGNESDVTASVVANLILKGEKGDQGTPGTPGSPGSSGQSCSVADNGDGSFTVTCGGGGTAILADPSYVPAAYTAADPIKGGTAYAKWWVTQAGGPGTLALAGVTVGGEWVRCKTCHGWDGLGNKASYAGRTGQNTGTATRPDVSTVDLRATTRATTPAQLFDLVKGVGKRTLDTQGNGHPDYSSALTDAQIWDLVKFMREGSIFPDALYYLAVDGPPVYKDSTDIVHSPVLTYYGIGANGDAANGVTVYDGSCAGCHGTDGQTLVLGGPATLGQFVRANPHEVWHKAKFGNISDSSVAQMPPGLVTDTGDLADLYRALTNSTTYP